MSITVIHNLLSQEEFDLVYERSKKGKWSFENASVISFESHKLPVFWYCELIKCRVHKIFENKMKKIYNANVHTERIYLNGQAHGQCGFWHIDSDQELNYTLVYFPTEWPPEYGGHLLIDYNNEIHSFLPSFNTAVLFNSNIPHMGCEPTTHCKGQRISLAFKFRVNKKLF